MAQVRSMYGRQLTTIWTAEEDALLLRAVAEGLRWAQVAERVSLARVVPPKNGKQCCQRWLRVLRPDIRKGNWSPDEDALLVEAISIHGIGSWKLISSFVPGRTGLQCRSRYYQHHTTHPLLAHITPTCRATSRAQAASIAASIAASHASHASHTSHTSHPPADPHADSASHSSPPHKILAFATTTATATATATTTATTTATAIRIHPTPHPYMFMTRNSNTNSNTNSNRNSNRNSDRDSSLDREPPPEAQHQPHVLASADALPALSVLSALSAAPSLSANVRHAPNSESNLHSHSESNSESAAHPRSGSDSLSESRSDSRSRTHSGSHSETRSAFGPVSERVSSIPPLAASGLHSLASLSQMLLRDHSPLSAPIFALSPQRSPQRSPPSPRTEKMALSWILN
eukprot:TRINITY_DN927_c0_g1_i7.p1 TRINITY_DN927_c0_g1~~TRINITY_DN927_c0_g1_i7.p1  ORF type:complete len:403 (+),score=41.70 TRINITY_DN927_c0_g1_i7:75-1283(+)